MEPASKTTISATFCLSIEEREDTDGFEKEINSQVALAIGEADSVLFLVDGKEGVTDGDRMIAQKLRKSKREIILLCNKIDTSDKESWVNEFWELGLGEHIWPVSANNGYGTGDLMEFLATKIPSDDEGLDTDLAKIAIVGKPNVGKSSLINQVFLSQNPEAIRIDQSAVGANSRSNPATYTGIMDEIRKAFATANKVNADRGRRGIEAIMTKLPYGKRKKTGA